VDPFLLTHKVDDGLYDIGPRISPISIRDQMIRGYCMVSRAHREGLIGADKPLLIVGAGAAGATAALAAVDRKVKVTVVEKATSAFGLQIGCHSRYVDPTMYDWPARHWERGEFPWAGSQLPLPWEGGLASVIAGFWDMEFKDRIAREKSHIKVLWGHELVACLVPGRPEVRFKEIATGSWSSPEQFAMIISCVGAGPDRVTIGAYFGKSFWKDDSYGEDNVGLPRGTSPRVLISGGGDGALQDFLRILTSDKPAKAIYKDLPSDVQADVSDYLGAKEQEYQRAFVWSGTRKEDDCEIQSSLHTAYEDVVNRIFAKHWRSVKKALETMLRDIKPIEINLAFECSHFSHCYALNHFLALLIASYVEKEFNKTVLVPHTRVVGLDSTGAHTCDPKNPNVCQKQSHNASSIPADCTTPRPAGTPPTSMAANPYNVIIVRHGIDWNSHLFGPPKANSRHILPYYLAWGE
jgi:hypothetical protein